ncbi:MAG: SDR family NAD(P)-dependent oxidoreductase [Planctomycetota bacterium]
MTPATPSKLLTIMPRSLQNKTILISGASSGIGRATALACAWAGMNVSISARRTDKLEQLAKQVSDLNRKAHFFTCDVSQPEQVKAWVAEAYDTMGRVDAVYANAGYGIVCPAMEMSLAQHRAMFEVNYFGTVHLLREALPCLGTTPDGLKHLLICSSCLSEVGPPASGVYAATKAAQDMLAQSMRAELAGEGYSVTSVHPVGTKTEFFDQAKKNTDPKYADSLDTPDFLMQTPEKVAKRIVGALRRPCAEVWPMRTARFAAAVATALPGVTAWVLRKGYEKKNGPPPDSSEAHATAEQAKSEA